MPQNAHAPAWTRRDEGSITILAMFVLVGMLLVAGMAVDLMRAEHERVRMQGATDRAALAATTLRENVSGAQPEQLAGAYMQSEGLGAHVAGRIAVVEAPGSRSVTLSPAATLQTGFMRLLGIDALPVQAHAQAVESLGRTRFEVVLALDVTGSMGATTAGGLTRIENLRIAAGDLVTSLLEGREPGEVALTIVPYAEHVLPPLGFLGHFPNLPAGGGACADFVFWDSVVNSLVQPMIRRTCATNGWRTVRPYVHDVAEAVAVVQGLQASGTTSIDLGVRFASLFFDPTIRPAVQQMVADGAVHPAFASHPLDWREPGVVRALVLMTDGANCCGARFAVGVQDDQTLASCTALRDQGVTIYAVAFEAPAAGVALMQGCASSPNHFFNTTGAGIADAFAAVATHLQTQALRLIQ